MYAKFSGIFLFLQIGETWKWKFCPAVGNKGLWGPSFISSFPGKLFLEELLALGTGTHPESSRMGSFIFTALHTYEGIYLLWEGPPMLFSLSACSSLTHKKCRDRPHVCWFQYSFTNSNLEGFSLYRILSTVQNWRSIYGLWNTEWFTAVRNVNHLCSCVTHLHI